MIGRLRKRLPILLPVAALLLIGIFLLARVYNPAPTLPQPERTVTAAAAGDYVGSVVEVCGLVGSTTYQPAIGGRPTFLNFGGPYPDQLFTVVIWGEDRQKWQPPPDEQYLGHTICASGRVRLHEGVPQIVVSDRRQIRFSN
ncbi:MAG: DNA-binding protein [Balneolaceae bacterium]